MNYLYKIKQKTILVLFLVIGFTSCNVINKKYKSPEVNTQSLFRAEIKDSNSIAAISWKEYFSDPILQKLIEEGLVKNYDLRIADEHIRQAEAGLLIAKGAFFPNVALVAQIQKNQYSSSNKIFSTSKNQYSLGIATSWEADVWGKLNSQKKARYAQFMATGAYRNLIQTSLIANIATSYYALMALDEQLLVTKETVRLLEETTTTMEELMSAGYLNAAAVEQNKSLLYATKVSIPDLEINIRILEHTISLLLGREPGTIERSLLSEQNIVPDLKIGIPVQMLAQRPDVLQAELSFRSAFELTNVAQAYLYPSFTLNSGSMIGYGAGSFSGFFKPQNIFANIIGGLTQPIFAQNQLKGQLMIAKSQQKEALLNFEKTVLAAGKEVSDIFYTYNTSLTKNELRDKQVDALNKSVDYTKALLQAGEANYIEVLNAEQNLLKARLGRVSDKLEQLQASVGLYRALGGGIK